MTTAATLTRTKATFSMGCAVEIAIRARPVTIWALLTNAADFPRWNSTVTRIEGEIREAGRVALQVPLTPRIFKLKVSAVVADHGMTWSSGFAPMFRGVRTFALVARDDGTTTFTMSERFAGLMLPMIKGSLPDFGPSFEQYALDLRRAAEGATT